MLAGKVRPTRELLTWNVGSGGPDLMQGKKEKKKDSGTRGWDVCVDGTDIPLTGASCLGSEEWWCCSLSIVG